MSFNVVFMQNEDEALVRLDAARLHRLKRSRLQANIKALIERHRPVLRRAGWSAEEIEEGLALHKAQILERIAELDRLGASGRTCDLIRFPDPVDKLLQDIRCGAP